MKILKKAAAFALALSSAASALAFSPRTAAAADQPLVITATFDRHLVSSQTNSVPNFPQGSYNGYAGDEVTVNWPFVDHNGQATSLGAYNLTYPIDGGRVVSVTFAKTSRDFMTVTYREYADTALTAENAYAGLEVYANDGQWHVPGGYPPEASAGPGGEPVFTFAQGSGGNGFSFTVNSETIRFRWDADGLHYTTNKFVTGRLTEFTLKYQANVPAVTSPQKTVKATALRGIDTSALAVRPRSSALNPPEPGKYDVDDTFDWTSAGGLAEYPGCPDDWIEIEVPLPKAWDAASNSFGRAAAPSDIPEMTLNMNLRNSGVPVQWDRSVTFDVFGGTTQGGSGTLLNNGIHAATQYYVTKFPNGGDVYNGTVESALSGVGSYMILLRGLTYGLLYDDSTFEIGTNSKAFGASFATKPARLNYDDVYTFLKYEVEYTNGVYNLRVQPYSGHPGSYVLTSSNSEYSGFKAGINVEGGASEPILLPLGVSAGGSITYYQILYSKLPFSPTDVNSWNGVISQKVKFTPTADSLSVNTPSGFDVTDSSVKMSPKKDGAPDSQQLTYTMTWNVIKYSAVKAMLDGLPAGQQEISVVYDLKRILSPIENNSPVVYAHLKIRFYYDGGVIKADFTEIDAGGNPVPPDKKIVVEKTGQSVRDARYSDNDDDGLANVIAGVDIDTTAFKLNTGHSAEYEYPNIYFLFVQPKTLQKGAGPAKDLEMSDSVFDSMTLNDISGLEVPPAQNVQAVEPKLTEPNQQMPAESSFKAKFAMPLDKVKEYLAKNLPYQDYDLTYNLYVSQDEDKIKALQQMGPERYDERAAACETVQWDKNWLTDYRIYFSDMNGASGVTTNAGETAIDALRAGKTVRAADMRLFENNADLLTAISKGEIIPVTYILDGLDKNQKYYIAADVSVNFADQANPPAPGVNEWKRSKMSNIAGITTIGDEIVPKPGEKTPPAPVLSKESIGLSYATVFWNRVKDQKPEGSADDYGKLEYEIIRLTSSQMPPSLLDQRIPFDDIYNGSLLPNVEKKGFRTENEAAALGEYNGRTNTLIPAADTRYNWDGGDPLKLTDNTLRPNGLYFYYVRTVRVINGKELYSPWANISVTTDPVKAPINLKIEREGYAYDPIHQFVISFDAPIGSLDALGRDYGLQYQLKEEAGDWGAPVDMDVGRLKANAKEITINGQKYYHFVYTVSGLKYGTHYAVWVRMKDLRYTDYSAWSNIAETRTEMDNDEYDKDKETDDWLDYLKDKLDELFKNDYWILMDGQTFLYRPGMFGGVILKNPGAEIKLAEAGGRRAEYLIPQSALELMNAQNKGLGLTISGVGVTISPKAVTDGLQAVRAAKERINAKQDADYYLRVTLTSSVYTAPVDGKAPASPRVEAAFDIVCARKAAKALDTDIINAALNQLKSDAAFKAAADAIKQMIAQNRKAEDIIAYINNFISQNLKAFYPNAYNLYAAQADIAYPVYETETPVYVKFTPENASDQVKGHRWAASGWAAAVTQRQGAAAAIVTKLAGAYIFTSSAVNMPGLSDFPDSEALVGIISKYGLDDYLGKGGAFNADGDLSAYAVAGVCARLMGAGTTEDPFAFIREKGYAVSVRGTAQAATQQETVYHVMNVYEQKTKTKVSVMKITNYAAVNGINIDGRYVKSVLAANETGVFNPKGMKPAGKVTARQLLTMITNLNKKVKL